MSHVKLPPLYLITDRMQTAGRPLIPLIERAIRAGVRFIQVRERELDTRSLVTLTSEVIRSARAGGALVFVNDRIDVAVSLETTGVHLRSDSLPIPVVRRLVGPNRLIGVSTHSPDDVLRAETEGADFVVLGPIYETPSKRPYGPPLGIGPLEETARRCSLPVYAIGGITPARVPDVKKAGAEGIAVVSAILTAPDVEDATRALLDAWEQTS